ncbi:MAG: hypothetical protein JSU63_05175 [Phycisphaerales bacterium]|nr:MAG: hypothetical protein JSU63_05175 [Phycisphaerales bacterium]
MRRKLNRSCALRLVSLTVLLMLATSCTIEFAPDELSPNDNSQPTDAGDEDVITVRLRNLSMSDPVEVEFYVAEAPLEAIPDDLFSDEHRIGDGNQIEGQGIGIANTGILEPGAQDTIILSCDHSYILGTTGGSFLDDESGEVKGVGTTLLVQQGDGYQFICNALIGFDYGPDTDGYKTILSLIGG